MPCKATSRTNKPDKTAHWENADGREIASALWRVRRNFEDAVKGRLRKSNENAPRMGRAQARPAAASGASQRLFPAPCSSAPCCGVISQRRATGRTRAQGSPSASAFPCKASRLSFLIALPFFSNVLRLARRPLLPFGPISPSLPSAPPGTTFRSSHAFFLRISAFSSKAPSSPSFLYPSPLFLRFPFHRLPFSLFLRSSSQFFPPRSHPAPFPRPEFPARLPGVGPCVARSSGIP